MSQTPSLSEAALEAAIGAYAKDTGAERHQLDGWIESALTAAFVAAARTLPESPDDHLMGSEPVAEIVEATSPAAELIFGRDIKFFESLRTLPIGTKLFAAPHVVESDAALRAAVEGIADDYMTSETHHPGWVLIPAAKFEAIRAALSAPEAEG